MVAVARFEPIRSLGFAGISGTYAAVGTPAEKLGRIICMSNNTQGDLLFSTDGVEDHIFIAAGSFKLYDIQANMNTNYDDRYVLPVGLQFYVKQITAPTSGSVYVEVLY